MKVKVKDIKKGDEVIMESGEKTKVKATSPGFWASSLMIDLTNGEWFCENKNSFIDIKRNKS